MEHDKELKAMADMVSALGDLEADAQVRVINYVLGRLGIRSPDGQLKQITNLPITGVQSGMPPINPSGDSGIFDILTLREQKNPKSAIQMAVLVAYYLKDFAPAGERKDTIDASDTEKFFTQAQFELPAGKNGAADTLNNAKRSGYLESVGTGVYKLNAVGYNLAAYRMNKQGSENVKKKRSKTKKVAHKTKKSYR